MSQNFRNQPKKFEAASFEEIKNNLGFLDISSGDHPTIFTKLNKEKSKEAISISDGTSPVNGSSNPRLLWAKEENTNHIADGKKSGDQKGKAVPRQRAGKAK